MPDPLAARMRLALKLLNLSSGQLASRLGVDKSVVSRWLSGAVRPGGHNHVRLTMLVAEQVPGFNLLDWEAPLDAFQARLSPPPAAMPPAGQSLESFDLLSFDKAMPETSATGERYCGVWRLWRPSLEQPGRVVRELVVIDAAPQMLSARIVGDGYHYNGFGFLTLGRMTIVVQNRYHFMSILLVRNDFIDIHAVDGLLVASAARADNAITATVVHLERLGADAGDAELIAAASAGLGLIDAEDAPARLAETLFPDSGPRVASDGGELLLRVAAAHGLTRGAY